MIPQLARYTAHTRLPAHTAYTAHTAHTIQPLIHLCKTLQKKVLAITKNIIYNSSISKQGKETMKAPIIITINKSSSELDYLIKVDRGSIRDNLAYMNISKDVAYDRIIKFLFQMCGIKDYNRYTDDAGDIFIEVTAPASQILTHDQKMEMQAGEVEDD